MSHDDRPARLQDVHDLALAMPHVTTYPGDNPVYQVGGRSFVFFRNPRPDAVDPDTGERYDDVIVFWVASEVDKDAMVRDPSTPYFTTPHFDGHLSVLLRGSRVGELTRRELAEVVQDAWLARPPSRWSSSPEPAEGVSRPREGSRGPVPHELQGSRGSRCAFAPRPPGSSTEVGTFSLVE